MTYDFSEIVPRLGTDCMKYDKVDWCCGNKDAIPMWVGMPFTLFIALFLTELPCITDSPDGYYEDWIPVASVEEGNLLNILLDVGGLEDYPCRHFRGNNHQYFWTQGPEPTPRDTAELQKQILQKYDLDSLDGIR